MRYDLSEIKWSANRGFMRETALLFLGKGKRDEPGGVSGVGGVFPWLFFFLSEISMRGLM